MSAASVLPSAFDGPRARACSVCGEFGHRADNARHRGHVAQPEATPQAAAPAHPWRSLSPAPSPPPAFRPSKRCSKCGSSEHRANNRVAHPTPEGAEETPASATNPALPRWTPADDAANDETLATRAIDRARAHATTTADGRHRSKTIPATARLRERRALALVVLNDDEFPDIPRPRTRGECAEVLRPCPFVSCGHHLYLDVDQNTGALKLNYPHLEPWEMGESCSLDVADRGGATLEEVGALVSVTRERARQLEERSIAKLRLRAPELAAASQNGEAP